MIWPWRRKPTVDTREGRHAVERGKQERRNAEAKNGHIDWLTEQLQRAQQNNHFTELVLEAMRRRAR